MGATPTIGAAANETSGVEDDNAKTNDKKSALKMLR